MNLIIVRETPLQISRFALAASRRFFAAVLILLGIGMTAISLYSATTHLPKISWIPGQQIVNDAKFFNKVYLSVWTDDDGPLSVAIFKIDNSPENLNFYTGDITPQSCTQSPSDPQSPAFGGWKLTFPQEVDDDGEATVTVSVTDQGSGAVTYTSFTLRKQNGAHDQPIVGGFPTNKSHLTLHSLMGRFSLLSMMLRRARKISMTHRVFQLQLPPATT